MLRDSFIQLRNQRTQHALEQFYLACYRAQIVVPGNQMDMNEFFCRVLHLLSPKTDLTSQVDY